MKKRRRVEKKEEKEENERRRKRRRKRGRRRRRREESGIVQQYGEKEPRAKYVGRISYAAVELCGRGHCDMRGWGYGCWHRRSPER